MGGINSLSGLNKVNVDFQPTITTNVQYTGNANQPQRFVNNLKSVCAEIHGELEDSGTDWSPLVRRLGAELDNAPESLSIIWP